MDIMAVVTSGTNLVQNMEGGSEGLNKSIIKDIIFCAFL
jgi:hypothetical protein